MLQITLFCDQSTLPIAKWSDFKHQRGSQRRLWASLTLPKATTMPPLSEKAPGFLQRRDCCSTIRGCPLKENGPVLVPNGWLQPNTLGTTVPKHCTSSAMLFRGKELGMDKLFYPGFEWFQKKNNCILVMNVSPKGKRYAREMCHSNPFKSNVAM